MGIRGWSRDHERCQGWDDAEGHHDCTSPTLPHAGGGRCTKCYALQRRVLGLNRDPFPSINDVQLPGEGPVMLREREPVMVNGQHDTPKIDRDVAASLGRFIPEVGAPATAIAPEPVKAPQVQAKNDAPNFEVFTIVGQTHTVGPSLTIRKDGRLSINPAAFAALGSPTTVELLYDRDQRILGVRACAPGVAHARPVQAEGKGSRVYVNVRPLLAHYGIAEASADRFATAKQYGDVLAVQLTLPEQAKGR